MATLVFFAAWPVLVPGRPCGSKKVLGSGRLSGVTVTGLCCQVARTAVSFACGSAGVGLPLFCLWGDCSPERVGAISTARLCTLPCLHLRPIDVIVSDGPRMEILSWGGLRA